MLVDDRGQSSMIVDVRRRSSTIVDNCRRSSSKRFSQFLCPQGYYYNPKTGFVAWTEREVVKANLMFYPCLRRVRLRPELMGPNGEVAYWYRLWPEKWEKRFVDDRRRSPPIIDERRCSSTTVDYRRQSSTILDDRRRLGR